jgi:predicted small lipoprotein YifL
MRTLFRRAPVLVILAVGLAGCGGPSTSTPVVQTTAPGDATLTPAGPNEVVLEVSGMT